MPRDAIDRLDSPGNRRRVFFPRRDHTEPPTGAVDVRIPLPQEAKSRTGAGAGAKPGESGKSDMRLVARWYRFDPRWPTILLFHGNGEVASDFDAVAPYYRTLHCNLFVAEYRGYGASDGEPSFRTLLPDAEATARVFLTELHKWSPSSMPVLLGRSLGSETATYLATTMPDRFAGLILESGFSDIVPILHRLGIFTWFQGDEIHRRFSNTPRLAELRIPVLILHGEVDELIPPENAKENFEAIPGRDKRLVFIPGAGHNTISIADARYSEALRDFLDELERRRRMKPGGENEGREKRH